MIESNLDPWPVQALEATLGLPTTRTDGPVELPPLWPWLYFLPTAPRSSIGPDGHMVNQEWVDSTLRRRRFFAAGHTQLIQPLQIGVRAQMAQRVLERREKIGKDMRLQIVALHNLYLRHDDLCVREERDI